MKKFLLLSFVWVLVFGACKSKISDQQKQQIDRDKKEFEQKSF